MLPDPLKAFVVTQSALNLFCLKKCGNYGLSPLLKLLATPLRHTVTVLTIAANVFCTVEEVTPGCETPPLRENGIVACVDPREDGRWELGDVCDYICPEGSF